nr:hypothetical protein [Tanacetum cinerariifolium]
MMSEEPNAAVAFMANLSSISSQVNEVHFDDNHIFDNVNHQLAQEMHQEEHLGFDDEYDFLTNTIPYKKLSLVSDAENVSIEASAATSDQIDMIAILNNLTSQVVGHAKTNQEITLENKTLKNELVRCKQEIGRLNTQKIKLDLENQVRHKQGLVIQQLQKKCFKVYMPTHTIPMLSKKPRRATADLHQDILGTRNPRLGYLAKRTQPVLYDGNTLLDSTHTPVSVWDSDNVLVHQVVSMHKMKDKPGHIRPESGFYAKLNAIKFVPQTELKALETELTQLKIQNDGFKVTNATQKTEIAKLKAKEVGNKSSGTTTPTNPKVLTLGMYAIGPKLRPIDRLLRKFGKKIVAHAKPQWMPTGRHFTLYDSYPLTRILDPMEEPLELSPSVSSSSNVTMLSRFANCQLSDIKAGSNGISAIFE